MGRKYSAKNLPLCAHRKSRKKYYVKRRKEREMQKLLLNKAQENANNAEKITNIKLSVKSVANINMEAEAGILHCLNQVMEKGNDNEEQIEIYKEEGIYDENVEYCKDENNSVIENQCFLDKEKKVEVYEVYEVYEEVYEEEEEKNTHTENIEYYDDMKDLIINNSLSVKINNIPKNVPEGRSIVDLSYMWNEIHRTFNDHARGIECQFKYWQLVNFCRRGLLTQLFFNCQMCKYQTSIWTEPMHKKKPNINAAATTGCVDVGIGYTQMKKLCTAMNIKYMSEPTHIKIRDNLVHKKTVLEDMKTESS